MIGKLLNREFQQELHRVGIEWYAFLQAWPGDTGDKIENALGLASDPPDFEVEGRGDRYYFDNLHDLAFVSGNHEGIWADPEGSKFFVHAPSGVALRIGWPHFTQDLPMCAFYNHPELADLTAPLSTQLLDADTLGYSFDWRDYDYWHAEDLAALVTQVMVASSKTAHEDLLRTLHALDDAPQVALALASNPSLPPDLLTNLAHHEETEIRRAVARNAATPPEILEGLARDEDRWVKVEVSGNPNTPVSLLEALAYDEDATVRLRVAQRDNTPTDSREASARDEDAVAKPTLAKRTKTLDSLVGASLEDKDAPAETPMIRSILDDTFRERLLRDGIEWFTYEVSISGDEERHIEVEVTDICPIDVDLDDDDEIAHIAVHQWGIYDPEREYNPDHPFEILVHVARGIAFEAPPYDPMDFNMAMQHFDSPDLADAESSRFQWLIQSYWSDSKYVFALSETTHESVFRDLYAVGSHPDIDFCLAANPGSPDYILSDLVKYGDIPLREAVARNPGASPELLHELAFDEADVVRQRVALNPRTPEATLALLA